MTSMARAEAERTTTEAQKKADTALSTAKAQAKKALDEATARATAIHDGAERRLNLLSTRHSETISRLSDILDGVSSLVTAERARPSLEDEVSQTAARTMSGPEAPAAPSSQAQPRQQGAAQARQPQPSVQPRTQPTGHAQSASGPVQSQLNTQLQGHAQPQHAPARTGAIDDDEQTEGVRIMPTTRSSQ
jgi:hypothetical protein